MAIVANANIVVVCAMSPHWMPLFVRLTGQSNAHIHRENRTVTIPGKVDQTER